MTKPPSLLALSACKIKKKKITALESAYSHDPHLPWALLKNGKYHD